jgi:hypothetical protein
MPREQLRALAADVDRLLVAGARAASGDEGLRRRARALRRLARQVPVLAQVADAVERVTESPAEQAAPALLDLLLLTRQLRASLASAGVEGPPEAIPASGPWSTEASLAAVEKARAALATEHEDRVRDAVPRATGDLRLVGPLLKALHSFRYEVTEFVCETALPAFGPAVLGELRRDLNLRRGSLDGWRLVAVARIDPALGAELCREALREGTAAVKPYALKALAFAAPAEAEPTALALLAGEGTDRELRRAAVQALALTGSKAKAVVAALVKALKDPDSALQALAAQALSAVGPEAEEAIPALIEVLGARSKEVVRAAIIALGAVGPKAAAAGPALYQLLWREDDLPDDLRVALAAGALLRIGEKTKTALERLKSILQTGHGEARQQAGLTLVELAPLVGGLAPLLSGP